MNRGGEAGKAWRRGKSRAGSRESSARGHPWPLSPSPERMVGSVSRWPRIARRGILGHRVLIGPGKQYSPPSREFVGRSGLENPRLGGQLFQRLRREVARAGAQVAEALGVLLEPAD